MSSNNKVQYLIVDTSAFIRNAPLQDIGLNIITEQDVVNEITSKRQLRRLVVLPYDLKVQTADPENIKFVTEFAKKTGDYTSLSATDIKVIALTYQLEKEKLGKGHLKDVPEVCKTVDSSVKQDEDLSKPLAGFYVPHLKSEHSENVEDRESSDNDIRIDKTEEHVEEQEKEDSQEGDIEKKTCFSDNSESDYETAESDIDKDTEDIPEDICDKFSKLKCEPTELLIKDENETEHNVDDILAPITSDNDDDIRNELDENESCEEVEYQDEDDDDDDDSGWITPKNISAVKKEIDSEVLEEKAVTVACLTMDFAMQNVLKQIGLNIAALDGRVIKQMRTFIFRCHACFKTTSIMTKVFCPSCGHKTLKKVAVSLDNEGKQQIHINFRKPISTKGKRFSLPMFRGGKHANNPILCEDQPLPDQRPTRLARTKNDPLQDDYIAGYSPFIMRDVNSKSAMLGIRSGSGIKYWMKKNPNENRRKRK